METILNFLDSSFDHLRWAFEDAWNRRENARNMVSLAVSDTWYNGTGYLDGARYVDVGVPVGMIGYGTDCHGRRVLIVPCGEFETTTRHHHGTHRNLVFFDRFSPNEDGSYNKTRGIADASVWLHQYRRLFKLCDHPAPAAIDSTNGMDPGYEDAIRDINWLMGEILSGVITFKETATA